MNVLCSAEKGEMTTRACLDCALAQKNSCGYDYSLLKAMFGTDEHDKRREEIHVTDITGCLRRSWYDKKLTTPEYVHEKLVKWLGVAIHAHTENSDEYLDSELVVAAEGLIGKADVVYKNGRVVDFKTTRWIYPDKLPYGSHSAQVNIYAWMLKRMGHEISSLQIQYVDASGPTKCRKCKVPVRLNSGVLCCPRCENEPKGAHLGALLVDIPILPEKEVETYILERIENLKAALDMGLEPKKEPGFLCAYCRHEDICQPETQGE